jgi:5'-deoxynucleotidase YfbR-like HD superfamily hydrolase
MAKANSVKDHTVNLSKVVIGDLARLRFVIRFSNCPRIHNESVGEHSFYTALYAYFISVSLRVQGFEVYVGQVLAKALMHDVDECISGDFIRMFKHSTPELKQAIDQASAKFTKGVLKDVAKTSLLADVYFADWEKAKLGNEGRIVAFADYLSVLSYIAQEIELGNVRMRRQIPELKKFHSSFCTPEFKFLEEYVNQAEEILKNLPEETHARRRV